MNLLEPGQRYAVSGDVRLTIDSVEGVGTAQFWVAHANGATSKLTFAEFSLHGIRQEMRELSTEYEINPAQLDRALQYLLVTDDRSAGEDLAITNRDDQRVHVPGRWVQNRPVIALQIQYLGEWKMTIAAEPFESPPIP